MKHEQRLVKSKFSSSALTLVGAKVSDIPKLEETPTLDSLSRLSEAIKEFQGTYEKFIDKNKDYLLIDAEVQEAFKKAGTVRDIRKAALTFADGIWCAMRTIENEKLSAQGK